MMKSYIFWSVIDSLEFVTIDVFVNKFLKGKY